MWSVTDGGTHLCVAPLSAQGTLLSRGPSLVGTGGDPADASGGLSLCLPARVQHPRSPRLDSLTARLVPLRRCRRQGADCSVDEVRALGAPRGWKPLVLNPSGAVADFRALVFHRRSRCHMSDSSGLRCAAGLVWPRAAIPDAASFLCKAHDEFARVAGSPWADDGKLGSRPGGGRVEVDDPRLRVLRNPRPKIRFVGCLVA